MLWRVRATMPDQPGSLANLALACGDAGINIRALQVFPGDFNVTDELVLEAPDELDAETIDSVIRSAAGWDVVVQSCTAEALSDQPTRYVQAAHAVVARPASFLEVVAELLDAHSDCVSDCPGSEAEFTVGDVDVAMHRATAFTPSEQARGEAIAALVSDVLARTKSSERPEAHVPTPRSASRRKPEYVVEESSVSALYRGTVVGFARLGPSGDGGQGGAVREVDLQVTSGWQRRGLGTRLLREAVLLASSLGAEEIVLSARADNPAVLPTVFAAGLRGRLRMAGDQLSVRVPVRDLVSGITVTSPE